MLSATPLRGIVCAICVRPFPNEHFHQYGDMFVCTKCFDDNKYELVMPIVSWLVGMSNAPKDLGARIYKHLERLDAA